MRNHANSLSSRRGRFEIISTLIAIAQQPVTMSHLLTKISLSSLSMKQYLTLMLEAGLISNHTIVKGKKKHYYPAYYATTKGNRFLELYCTNLLLFTENNTLEDNLADKYLLQYCMNNKTTLISNLYDPPTVLAPEINRF